MKLHFHWHTEVRRGAVWSYLQCRCGHRIARRITPGDYSYWPVDKQWLEGGEFRKPPTDPPPKPSDAARSASPNAARVAAGLMPAPPAVSWHGPPLWPWAALAPGWISLSPGQRRAIDAALEERGISLAEVLAKEEARLREAVRAACGDGSVEVVPSMTCGSCGHEVRSTLTDQCPHCGAANYGRVE